MHYVKVLVGEATFHGQEALTYACSEPLVPGSLVVVPLRRKSVLGVVTQTVDKPEFTVKSILDAPKVAPLPDTILTLLEWLKEYYPAPLGIITQLFLPRQLPKTNEPMQQTPALPAAAALPSLTDDQRDAVASIHGPGLHLLHGETGTGKTRVYIELAKKALAEGKSSLILTPEIGLTAQLTASFQEVFGDRVLLLHSQLGEAARRKLWVRALQQREPSIIIGPRGALFTPVRNVGLVVVDEAHETAYKQDRAPYYHASHVAGKLAQLHNATFVLGSATPLVTDYYVATTRNRPIIRMLKTAASTDDIKRSVETVDLRERSNFTQNPYISDKLLKAIQTTLHRNEQALLFLNRRGTARIVFCEQCGWQATCPRCDVPLVYHGDTHNMRCHTCSYRQTVLASCPMCTNPSIVFRSIGTKAIADSVAKLFPGAKVQRFDTDNKKIERIESHYTALQRGHTDIIVGTQTVAKGIDLPKLGLVGVVMADTSLSFPDFSAQERTYQLLSQVIGRIGRGHRASSAIIQTYNPGSSLLRAVLSRGWNTFYADELAERRAFNFPPFCFLLKLSCQRATSKAAAAAAQQLANKLKLHSTGYTLEGPTPSFYEKSQNKYQWQLVVKAKKRTELTKIINQLPSGWTYDIDPLNLL